MSIYVETKRPLGHGHSGPPDSVLDLFLQWGKTEDAAVFAPNSARDIYSVIRPRLAPDGWLDDWHRRAGMLEGFRAIGADEADFKWTVGRDVTAGRETPEEMEAGMFQVSFNSSRLAPSLAAFLASKGISDPWTFQERIKAEPMLDMSYTARLLRVRTTWDGPINRGWVGAQVSPAACQEFRRLLQTP